MCVNFTKLLIKVDKTIENIFGWNFFFNFLVIIKGFHLFKTMIMVDLYTKYVITVN
jgi:hypothetical protein